MFFGMRKRVEEQYDEPNYWISFTDFALSFLISFILLSSLMLAHQYKQKVALEKSIEKIQENYAVRANIAKKLKETFKNDSSVVVHPESGRITLIENAIEFEAWSAKLISNPVYIDNFFKKYINALQNALSPDGSINYYNDDYIERIIIEGHVHKTDEYSTGMELSQDRALVVYNQVYSQIKYDEKLKKKVQAVGRGHFDPYKEDGKNPAANRRVEFHFTLNEEKIAKEQSQVIIDSQLSSESIGE